jgi:hypothetical protein
VLLADSRSPSILLRLLRAVQRGNRGVFSPEQYQIVNVRRSVRYGAMLFLEGSPSGEWQARYREVEVEQQHFSA